MPKNHKYIFLLESIIILLFFSGCLKNNTNELTEEILQNISNQYKVNCPIVSAESVLAPQKKLHPFFFWMQPFLLFFTAPFTIKI